MDRMTDFASRPTANSTASESLPAAAGELTTRIRANELVAEWIGYRLGSGQEINMADLQAEWEAAKVRAEKEKCNG